MCDSLLAEPRLCNLTPPQAVRLGVDIGGTAMIGREDANERESPLEMRSALRGSPAAVTTPAAVAKSMPSALRPMHSRSACNGPVTGL